MIKASNEEIQDIIKKNSVSMEAFNFPGQFLRLDHEEIYVEGRVTYMSLVAWFDDNEDEGMPRCHFMIDLHGDSTIICTHFFQAIGVWQHFQEIYDVDLMPEEAV
jgi:hypothetical protein